MRAVGETITCSFCGREFSLEESVKSCAGCSLFGTGGCRKVRCPHCGYEMPPPARLPGLIRRLARRARKTSEQ